MKYIHAHYDPIFGRLKITRQGKTLLNVIVQDCDAEDIDYWNSILVDNVQWDVNLHLDDGVPYNLTAYGVNERHQTDTSVYYTIPLAYGVTPRRKEKRWHGKLPGKSQSLFDCGLLVRWAGLQWLVAFRIDEQTFGLGYLDRYKFDNLFREGEPARKFTEFMDNCCSYWTEWLNLPMIARIDDYIAFFDQPDLFREGEFIRYDIAGICKITGVRRPRNK